jgi:hypothetical protein
MKARKSPRWHPPRPWRSRQETDAIKRLVWRWYTHTGPGTTRESGRVVARHLGVSHTYIQKLCRQFANDPSQMQERDRYEGRSVEAMLKELEYGRQCTQDMGERGVPGELLFRVSTRHVTLLRSKRPADAPLCSSCGWRIVTGEPILPVIALRK